MVVLKAGEESRGNAKKVMQNQTAAVNTLLSPNAWPMLAVEIGASPKGLPRRSMRTCHHVSACAGSNQLQVAVDSHLLILLVGLLAMDTLLSGGALGSKAAMVHTLQPN